MDCIDKNCLVIVVLFFDCFFSFYFFALFSYVIAFIVNVVFHNVNYQLSPNIRLSFYEFVFTHFPFLVGLFSYFILIFSYYIMSYL